MQPSTSLLLQNAAPKIASILSSFKDDDDTTVEGTEKLLFEDTSHPTMTTEVTKELLKQWQTPHLPILTNRQLEMSLLEIERRRKLKLKKLQQRDDKTSSTHQHSIAVKTNNEAAILIPLCSVQGTPSILFTRRAATLSNHASQISFPGGYYDEQLDGTKRDGMHDDDDRLINTALRETQEELCYNTTQFPTSSLITVLGRTQPVPSIQGKKVTPIIAMINYDLPSDSSVEFERIFLGNQDEVDWIFTVPIRELIEGETSEPLERWKSASYSHDDGKGNKKNEKKRGGGEVRGPAFHVPESNKKREGDKIWGLTAIVLRPLLRKVFEPVFCGVDAGGGNAKL